MESRIDRQRMETFHGLLLGTAAGDAVGLPAEGMGAGRIARTYKGRWHHRLLPGCGTVSDDTDHAFLTAHCLLEHPESVTGFERSLARSLRLWLATLPAGIGFATLRSLGKLWLGFSTKSSGVPSAGNGPAMRVAMVGAFHANEPARLKEYVSACTTLTHTDSRALTGALAIALLAAGISEGKWKEQAPDNMALIETIQALDPDDEEWQYIVTSIIDARTQKLSLKEYALKLGVEEGVSGYVYHTVPIAIYAWLIHHGDYRATVEAVLNAGGDTDTGAAIAGALAGAVTGPDGIPRQWTKGLIGWPITLGRMEQLSRALSMSMAGPGPDAKRLPLPFFWLMCMRNLAIMPVILCHALRRLLPPY